MEHGGEATRHRRARGGRVTRRCAGATVPSSSVRAASNDWIRQPLAVGSACHQLADPARRPCERRKRKEEDANRGKGGLEQNLLCRERRGEEWALDGGGRGVEKDLGTEERTRKEMERGLEAEETSKGVHVKMEVQFKSTSSPFQSP
ncbi:hypothetical protein EJB05_12310, partial [Eragrostis curvula]